MARGRHEYSFEILKSAVNSNRKSEGNKVKKVLEDTETTTLFFKTMAWYWVGDIGDLQNPVRSASSYFNTTFAD